MYQKIYFINKSNKTWSSRNIENIRTKKRLITIILGNDLQLKIFQLLLHTLRTCRMYGSNLSLNSSHPFVNIHVGDVTICVSRPGGAELRKEDSPERSPRPKYEDGGS